MRANSPLTVLGILVLTGCATTSATRANGPRQRRRAASTETSSANAEASVGYDTGLALSSGAPRAEETARNARYAMGTPVISGDERGELNPRWSSDGRRARIRCEGSAPAAVPSSQSPYEPGDAAVARSFGPAERRVLACRPPVNVNGRFQVRGEFTSNGAPREFTFPDANLTQDQALCVGAALCDLRVPAFRAAVSSVPYDYLMPAR